MCSGASRLIPAKLVCDPQDLFWAIPAHPSWMSALVCQSGCKRRCSESSKVTTPPLCAGDASVQQMLVHFPTRRRLTSKSADTNYLSAPPSPTTTNGGQTDGCAAGARGLVATVIASRAWRRASARPSHLFVANALTAPVTSARPDNASAASPWLVPPAVLQADRTTQSVSTLRDAIWLSHQRMQMSKTLWNQRCSWKQGPDSPRRLAE